MTKLLLLMAILWSSACCTVAQLGETKDQLSRRYGAPIPFAPPSSPPAEFDDGCWFHRDRLKVLAYFTRGAAVKLQYTVKHFSIDLAVTKRGKSSMTEQDIASLLQTAVKNPDWVLIASEGPVRRWRTRDSSAFAYYFGYSAGFGPRRWQGPDHALWVQTAAVDAAYQAAEERRRARFGNRSNQAMQVTATRYAFTFYYD